MFNICMGSPNSVLEVAVKTSRSAFEGTRGRSPALRRRPDSEANLPGATYRPTGTAIPGF